LLSGNSAGLPEDAPLVALRRGAIVESVHRGRVAVCDPSGAVLDAIGDPGGYVYARSSAKPFQALPLLLTGAAADRGLTDEEIAVACGSHGGEERHLAAVRSMLDKAGLSEKNLQSGAHPPMYGPAADALAQSGRRPGPIHGNCSGKHAGMLAVCVHEGWDTTGYRDPGHRLQRRIVEVLGEVCGLDHDEILVGLDGCGVPAFALPLSNLAAGFARLATGENLHDDLADAAGRVVRAMRGHPFMVAGTGRLDTAVMNGTSLVTKVGAEAVFAAGSPEGWGMAIKISDGAGRALRPVALAALARRGTKPPDEPETAPVLNLHGEHAGTVAPLF
jgi:L-asparaginase II